MIFDAEKGDKGLVKDALGCVIFHPIKGDTLTGRVVCYVPSGVGNEILLDGDDGLVREAHVYRAPLSVSPLGDFSTLKYTGPWATPVYKERIQS